MCFWEDDQSQFDDPDYTGGANASSLNEARATFARIGASSADDLEFVRAPLPNETPRCEIPRASERTIRAERETDGRPISNNNLVESLLRLVPEFGLEPGEKDPELPYVVLGGFALFVRNLLRDSSADPDLVERCMSFLQLMADSSDADVENLLVVGILEVLADEPECRRQVSARLGQRISELFDEVERFWRGGG